MRTIAWGIVLTLLWLPRNAAAQDCPPAGGTYEGFMVKSVSIETPLQFPIRWIERSLLGPAIDSLDSIAQNLPLKPGQPFSFVNHVASLQAITDAHAQLRSGERVKLAVGVPRFSSCDFTARSVDVVYRVYSTEAAYFVSRLLDVPQDVPARELTIGKASEKDGKILPVPFVSYNHESGLFGGASASWNKRGGFLNAVDVMAGGSSSSYRTAFSTGGRHDPGGGLLSHVEWNVGARLTKDPAAAELTLRESIGKADFFAATRAHGKFATIVRFGTAFEGGTVGSDVTPGLVVEEPKRSLKSFVGGTWSRNRQRWDASYGFEIGKGTDVTPVDFRKHVVDLAHQVRLLPREHRPIQLDTHWSAGSISGDPAMVPVAERFFGGNVVGNFVNNPLWKMPAGPLIRSFPQNTLNALVGQPMGGTSFTALNITAALPAWGIPAMPSLIRNAKPLAGAIHNGVKGAQAESRKDYLARTPNFAQVLTRVDAVVPDFKDAKTRLESLAGRNLPSEVVDELNGLVLIIDDALAKHEKAKKASRSGIAWDVCVSLAGADPDTFTLAHLHRELNEVVSPALETANLAEDARALRESADRFEAHRQALATLIDPLALSAMVDRNELDALGPALSDVAAHASRLKSALDALGPRAQPIGTLAFTASEWATAVITSASPEPDVDLSDRLYEVTSLTLGIGKLVPPQIESAISAAAELSATLKSGGETDAARAIDDASGALRQDLLALAPRVSALQIPAAERWAREQNGYFVRALDVAFREMTLAGVRYVAAVDVARLRSSTGESGNRYGLGAGVQLSIVTFQVTMGYSFNPDRRESESRGAFFFLMEVADLFR